jgi:hypothetical protein
MDGGEWRKTDPVGNRTPVVPVTNHPNNTQTGFMDIQLINYVAKTPIIQLPIQLRGSRVSSGSIVSDYGLDDREIGVRSPAGAKDFSSSLFVQTGSGAHPASCTMGTGGPFSGVKRGRGVTLTTHTHLVPRSWMSRSYTPLPPSASMACNGTALLY